MKTEPTLTPISRRVALMLTFVYALFSCTSTYAQPTTAAPAPSIPAARVLSMFNSSGTYVDHGGVVWLAGWSQAPGSGTYAIPSTSSTVRLYSSLNFAGIEFYDPNQIDVSAFDTLHLDVWTPNADQFGIQLVSLNPTVGPQVNITPADGLITSNSWVSLSIPLSSFTAANPAVVLSHLQQMLFIDNMSGGATLGDFYIDNIYFSSPTNVTVAVPTENVAVNAASMTNGYIYDLTYGFGYGAVALSDLSASYAGPVLTLAPSSLGDLFPDNIAATLFAQDDSIAGKDVIFSGTCNSYTLANGYSTVAFVRDFDGQWNQVGSATVQLASGQPFSVHLVTSASHHIQYGFETVGNVTDAATLPSLGNVQIQAIPLAADVAIDPAKTWSGYVNIFDLGMSYLWGSAWATADLPATFGSNDNDASFVTLSPNVNLYAASDPYWVNPGGSGAKIVQANYMVEDNSLAGQKVVFSGYCWENSLASNYSAIAFIKDLNPSDGYSTTMTNITLTPGKFSISFDTSPGHIVQYGFCTTGPDANPATVATLGKAIVSASPIPVSVNINSLAQSNWAGSMNVFNLPEDGGGYVFNSAWGLSDLPAIYQLGVVTLAPNTSISRDVPASDSFWWKPDGSGNKKMDANYIVEDNSLADRTVTFEGTCYENTLVAPYVAEAFIQEFDGAWNIVSQSLAELSNGVPFEATLTTTAAAGHHIRYGFRTIGPNASTNNASALGDVVVGTPLAPIVVTQPVGQAAAVGGSATFSVTAAGLGLTYQWLQNGTNAPYPTANSASLTVTGITAAKSGYIYSVIVSNIVGASVTSSGAYLGVTSSGLPSVPTVAITGPVNKSELSGLNLPLVGKATDALRVASVKVSLNGAAYFDAIITNTNPKSITWGLPLTLTAGTNTVKVKSINYAGVESKTVTNTYFAKVLSTFAIVTNASGAGRITVSPPLPAYVGRAYTIVAKPDSKSVLSNIVNDATSGTTIIPNPTPLKPIKLVLIAEASNTVTINLMTNRFIGALGKYNGLFMGSKQSGGLATVAGDANVYVDSNKTWTGYVNVFDGGTYQWGSEWAIDALPATFSGDQLTLGPNVNTYNASDPYWVNPDGSGAKNVEANFYVIDDSLAGQTVAFNGYCVSNTLVAPYTSVAFIKVFAPDYSWNYSGTAPLITGQPFSVTLATSAGVHVQYGFQTTGPDANPATVASLGQVIIAPGAPVVTVPDVKQSSSGLITVKPTAAMAYNATLYLDGDLIKNIKGTFDLNGQSITNITRTNGKPALNLTLQLGFNDKLTGTVSCPTDGWSSEIDADCGEFSALNKATTLAGQYTMLIPGFTSAADGPIGDGFALININTSGQIVASGNTADNQLLNPVSVPVSASGRWPFYARQYATATGYNGCVMGWVQFSNNAPTATISGDLYWIKTGWTNGYYNAGFTNHVSAPGSVFIAPAKLPFLTATATYSGGELIGSVADQLAISNGTTVKTTNLLPLGSVYGYSAGTGVLTVKKGTNNTAAMYPIKGCCLQNQNYIGGYFVGASQCGKLRVQ